MSSRAREVTSHHECVFSNMNTHSDILQAQMRAFCTQNGYHAMVKPGVMHTL